MGRRTLLRASCLLLLVLAGCSDGETTTGSAGSGSTGAGGSPLTDVACDNPLGCVQGQVDFGLDCTAPDDGSGVTSWKSSFSLTIDPATGGSCTVEPSGEIALAFGSSNENSAGIRVPFTGGGKYHLGGDAQLGQGEQLNIHATGGRTGPAGSTDADTLDTCSPGCELDVQPEGLQPIADAWVTYRFVVTCDKPLGTDDRGCGQCTMTPPSFQVDAACYSVPKH